MTESTTPAEAEGEFYTPAELEAKAQEKHDKVAAAVELLLANGYAIKKKPGQSIIQIVRKRDDDACSWSYHVNKYEKRIFAEPGQEIETLTLSLDKIPWEKCDTVERIRNGLKAIENGTIPADSDTKPGKRDTIKEDSGKAPE